MNIILPLVVGLIIICPEFLLPVLFVIGTLGVIGSQKGGG